MNRLLFSLIVLFSCTDKVSAKPPSELQCKVVALHRECSGCSLRGTKAILDVIYNRQRIDHKTACQVIRSTAFPWSSSQKSWKFTTEQLTRYFSVLQLLPVVSDKTYFFNTEKMPYGKFAMKIETHLFYEKT